MRFKACYTCNIKWPLFMFKTDRRKFKLAIALGKVRNCKICSHKESKHEVVRYNFDINKFEIVKLNWKQRLRELIK
jgi:hypothetical protein